MRWIAFDISNLLYRTFFANKQETDTVAAGLATHQGLTTLMKYFRKFNPDRVVMAFDRHSWRKDYTASELCVSKKPYKGNRNNDLTPAQQEKYERFIAHMREFERMICEHTTVVSLVSDMLEADDLIAGFCQAHPNDTDEIIVITTDSDMWQLMRQSNVRIHSPATDTDADLSEYNDDPDYYTFVKCVRGDRTDNVQSALPRVRETRLAQAYVDPFEHVQLMKTTWTDQNGVEFLVEDLFHENEILINLTKQPKSIRKLIDDTVQESINKHREFSMFHILKFIGKLKLKKIQDSLDLYIPMLGK
jgi:hypothetical protein